MNAEDIAKDVAAYLEARDDIAKAHAWKSDPGRIHVKTQGGKFYVVFIEPEEDEPT